MTYTSPAIEHTLLLGVDPSSDLPAGRCPCGPDGHALLALLLRRTVVPGRDGVQVWNHELKVARATLLRLRDRGLVFVLVGDEGGWPARWWSAEATPAGLLHAAQLAGVADQHGCGSGVWGENGQCPCGVWRSLTISLAEARLAHMPAGPDRDLEQWASQFVCPRHGRARTAMVRTDKCCATCGEGFVRSSAITPAADH